MLPYVAVSGAVQQMSDKKLILLIDDDDAVRVAVSEILRKAGYAAIAVRNGLDALEHVAAYGPPALIFIDLTMPVMDGRQFLAERRKFASLAHVPFVVITAYGDVTAADLGVAEVLKTPLELDRLLALARRYASGRSGTYTAVTDTPSDSKVGKK